MLLTRAISSELNEEKLIVVRSIVAAIVLVLVLGTALAGPLEDADQAYARQDYATARQLWQSLADRGDSSAQNNVAVLYSRGQGVAKDDQQAVFWYRRSAELGNALGQYNLGMAYSYGRGIQKDDRQAAFWYGKAAEQGVLNAQHDLAVMYSEGRGVSKDDHQALSWYRLAAERGFADSQNNLGVLYANGIGVPKDDQQAYFWFLLAAAGGADAVRNRDLSESRLTAEQRARAQAEARNWKPRP